MPKTFNVLEEIKEQCFTMTSCSEGNAHNRKKGGKI